MPTAGSYSVSGWRVANHDGGGGPEPPGTHLLQRLVGWHMRFSSRAIAALSARSLVSVGREAGHQVDGLELGVYEGPHPWPIGASRPVVDIE